jgi:hypothetical protein
VATSEIFAFDWWDAQAVYFEDPAGNIVELIAHRDLGAAGTTGVFDPRELVGVSELGVVGDRRALYADLAALGLELESGSLDEPGGLAFVGEKGRVLILSPPGRGWMPTGRPAEPHPVEAVLDVGRFSSGATPRRAG